MQKNAKFPRFSERGAIKIRSGGWGVYPPCDHVRMTVLRLGWRARDHPALCARMQPSEEVKQIEEQDDFFKLKEGRYCRCWQQS